MGAIKCTDLHTHVLTKLDILKVILRCGRKIELAAYRISDAWFLNG